MGAWGAGWRAEGVVAEGHRAAMRVGSWATEAMGSEMGMAGARAEAAAMAVGLGQTHRL